MLHIDTVSISILPAVYVKIPDDGLGYIQDFSSTFFMFRLFTESMTEDSLQSFEATNSISYTPVNSPIKMVSVSDSESMFWFVSIQFKLE